MTGKARALVHAASGGPCSPARRIEALALLATIPAFYLALLPPQRGVGNILYLGAFASSAVVTATEAWSRRAPRSQGSGPPWSRLGALLCTALLLSALLPSGDTPDLLILRLGTAALVLLRWSESLLPPGWRGELPQLLGLGIGMLGLCGVGFWWLEPNAPTFADGLWLAFTTAATVGYGDIVPSTPGAKIFAVFVVLMGLAVLSLVTAAIAALWVQNEERRIEHEVLQHLHRELKSIRQELAQIRCDRASTAKAGPPCSPLHRQA